MYNFEYKNPVKIIFGHNTIAKLVDELPKTGRILFTYGGGSIKSTGVYDQVIKALKGLEWFEFGGIEVNPSYETCMKAVEVVNEKQIDFLLAVGGGSVLDATKFIAAATLYDDGDPWNILAKKAPVKAAVPLGAVITLPATGSEMNGNAVITKLATREKLSFGSPEVMPQFSIMDPQCVFTLPDRQVANGIVDSFIHVIEQYLTFNVNAPLQDRFAEGILLTLIEEGPKVLANRADYDAAANFMWCATMALNGLIGVGVPQDWATHNIGHDLTALHGIDHARTLAIVLPGLMHLKRESKKEKLLQYGERIWGITGGSDDERIDAAIAKTIAFFESVGIPTTLPEYNVPADTVNVIANRFKERGYLYGEKKDIGHQEVAAILNNRL